MESKEGTMKKAKTIFEKLKTDVIIYIFTDEKINNRLFKKLQKWSYHEDKNLANLILAVENFDDLNRKESKTLPIRLDFVKK